MGFKWEYDLLRVLDTKITDGRNSSVFSSRNVHIATSPLGEKAGEHILIGKDRLINPQNARDISIAAIDFQHAFP